MNDIRMDCDCCRVAVQPAAKPGLHMRIRFNGTEYMGLELIAARCGMTSTQLRKRLLRGHCLQASTEELKRRVFTKTDESSQALAAAFCRLPVFD